MDFIGLVKYHFDFLISDFGFSGMYERTDLKYFGNSVIRFESSKVGINIILDRGQVEAYLGQLTTPADDCYDIRDVLFYFAPHIDEVNTWLNNVPYEENIQLQVAKLANLMKAYCSPILNGDFSMEKGIKKVRENRAKKFMNEMKKRYPQLRDLE